MNLQVGVKVLLQNNQGQYLMIKRSEPLPDGTGIKWDIPGGRIQAGERLAAALEREVREETGLRLNGPAQLISAQDVMLTKTGVHVVRLTYAARLDQEPDLSEEHTTSAWASRSEALLFDIDPYLRAVLESEVK